jgi:hypothetical protein
LKFLYQVNRGKDDAGDSSCPTTVPPMYGDKDVLAARGFSHYEDQNAAEKPCRNCQFFFILMKKDFLNILGEAPSIIIDMNTTAPAGRYCGGSW